MSMSFARRSAAAAVTVSAMLAVSVTASSPAGAAQPEEGRYRYYVPDPETPDVVKDGIFFEVRELRGDNVISDVDWISDVCGRMEIPESLPVDAQGKATYKGPATRAGGTPIQVKLKIKFTKATKATVTVKDRDPAVDCIALRKVKARPY